MHRTSNNDLSELQPSKSPWACGSPGGCRPMHEAARSTADFREPLVTIAIPTRNRASIMIGCVASALAQSYRNIEVLVSDNASEDDTLAILGSICDHRLRVLTQPKNIGLAGNWNKCLREAAGEYFVIISDDDKLAHHFVEKCLDLVRQEPGIPIVVSAYEVFMSDEDRTVPAVLSKKLDTGIWDGPEVLKEYLRGKLSALTLSSIMRTDLLRRNGGFCSNHEHSCDLLAWAPLLLEGRVGLVNECCASYRISNSSFTATLSVDYCFRDVCAVTEKISAAAARAIADEVVRRDVQGHTKRYVAFKAIENLVISRRNGATLIDVIRQLWGWREKLSDCTLADFLGSARPRSIARILLPTPAIRLLRHVGIS